MSNHQHVNIAHIFNTFNIVDIIVIVNIVNIVNMVQIVVIASTSTFVLSIFDKKSIWSAFGEKLQKTEPVENCHSIAMAPTKAPREMFYLQKYVSTKSNSVA